MNPILGIKDPIQSQDGVYRQQGRLPRLRRQLYSRHRSHPDRHQLLRARPEGRSRLDAATIRRTSTKPTLPHGQRNIFRQATQKRLDHLRPQDFQVTEQIGLQYEFNVFNMTNTTSLDVPMNQGQIRQNSACSTSATQQASPTIRTASPARITRQLRPDRHQPQRRRSAIGARQPGPVALHHRLRQRASVPTRFRSARAPALRSTPSPAGCPNNAANFGSVLQHHRGNRAFTMGIHFTY